jgi:hypothetical protein
MQDPGIAWPLHMILGLQAPRAFRGIHIPPHPHFAPRIFFAIKGLFRDFDYPLSGAKCRYRHINASLSISKDSDFPPFSCLLMFCRFQRK